MTWVKGFTIKSKFADDTKLFWIVKSQADGEEPQEDLTKQCMQKNMANKLHC